MKIRIAIYPAFLLIFCLHTFIQPLAAQQKVKVDIIVDSIRKPISPYLYGKNNSLSDNPGKPLPAYDWQRIKDAGIRMFRENGGNNATKYNWRRKLSSHPDWYNNVYAHDWGYAALRLQQNIPGAQGMWAFQLIGKSAKTNAANFNDWGYNGSKWWEGVGQNLAGGGTLNPAGTGKALVEGNPNLYLEEWPADSTVAILDAWFGPGGLGLDSAQIRYWSMDNEPEIWSGTHDDVYPNQPPAEDFMQAYFKVAKKARAKFPAIKLIGPVPANEWQWYNYNGGKIDYKGKRYTWLEYFIMRVAEEQKATGIRLLDVIDIHFYPGETTPADILQLHRVFFDRNYEYPGANGVKRAGTLDWDANIKKEYIFGRCTDWLNQYMGINHGVTFGVSETSTKNENPAITAVWYASTLGEFAKQGVEIFTPWDWKTGMYEVVHLFSQYGKGFYIPSISSDEELVTAYPMVSGNNDSMTVFLVNRSTSVEKNASIGLPGFPLKNGWYKTWQISQLPQNETFVSHTQNGLKEGLAKAVFNKIDLTLPPLSITAICLNATNENLKTVLFKIKGTNGIITKSLENAAITIDGDTLFSDKNGEATANISLGNHSLAISKNGYWPRDTIFAVLSDTTISEVMAEKTLNVTFAIKDKTTNLPIDSAQILIGNEIHFTGIDGTAAFKALPLEFIVNISKKHYRDTVFSLSITEDKTFTLLIEPVKYRVEFRTFNVYTNETISDVNINIGNVSSKTNNSGRVLLYLKHSTYPLKVMHNYYEQINEAITISSDTLIPFRLSPVIADVRFWLKKGNTPVDNSTVEMNDTTFLTNSLGMATFYGIPTKANYAYNITKDGYQNFSGNFYLRQDTTIDISMVLSGFEDIPGRVPTIELWPNPAASAIYIRVNSANPSVTVRISGISGERIETKKIRSNEISIFDTNAYPSGVYIVQIDVGSKMATKYFVKL
jgi:hypothetical protein